MNVVEMVMVAVGVLWYCKSARAGRGAEVLLFASVVMTFSKTVLFMAKEGLGGWSHVKQTSMMDFVTLWVLPNGAWILFPGIMMLQWGAALASPERLKSD